MSPVSDTVERLAREHGHSPLDVLEFYLERAAIREHDGGMVRSEAEIAALEDVRIWIGLADQMRSQQSTNRGGR